MAGGDAAALARRITSLLAPEPSDDRPVAVASIRAIHVAHAVDMPPVAIIATSHDAQLDGAFLHRRAWSDGDSDAVDAALHAELALDIRAGIEDPDAVLPDLVHHVLRGRRPELVERCLELPIDLLQHDAPARVIDVLVAATVSMADDLRSTSDPIRALAAAVAVRSGDARAGELLRDVAKRADARGDAREAARARYAASWTADGDEFAALRRAIRDAGSATGGWDRRVVALDLADDDVDASISAERDAVRSALAAGDGELEASALLGLDTHASMAGELDRAIRLQRRCVEVATRARAWRPAVFAHSNLAWSLMTRLELDEAVRVCRSMLALVEEQALRVHDEDARLQAATVLLAAGDHVAAMQLVTGLIDTGALAEEDRSWDAAYRALRIAEVLLRSDAHAAMPWVEQARRCIGELDGGDLDLDLALLEVDLYDGERRRAAQDVLVDRIGSDQALNEAQAISALARAIAIDADDHAREQLPTALGNVAWPRPPMLELACDEAAAVRSGSADRLLDVARRWRAAGFVLDAALVEAGAAFVSIGAGSGRAGGDLLESAHASLASLGAVRALERIRAARDRELGPSAAPRRANAHGWLVGVPDSTRIELQAIAVRTTIAAGRHLPEGMIGTIVDGCLLLEAANGRAVHAVGAGEAIGLGRLVDVDHGASTGSVRTLTTCVIDAYPRDVLVVRLATDAGFARAVAAAGVAEASRMFEAVRIHGEPTMDERVIAVLQHLATCVGTERREGRVVLRAAVSRELIGELVGASRESVTRALTRLADAERIHRVGRRISIAPVRERER